MHVLVPCEEVTWCNINWRKDLIQLSLKYKHKTNSSMLATGYRRFSSDDVNRHKEKALKIFLCTILPVHFFQGAIGALVVVTAYGT